MIECFNYETAQFFGNSLAQQHKLRHKVFIARQSWDVPHYKGMEYDHYDTPAAYYLTYRDTSGVVRGIARLLPTSCPYMLQEVFPDMVNRNLESSEKIWEGTRFAIDHDLPVDIRKKILNELVCAWLEFGILHNISEYWLLTQSFILKTFQKMGCEIEALGNVKKINGEKVLAASSLVSPDILKQVRKTTGIDQNVLITAEDLSNQQQAA